MTSRDKKQFITSRQIFKFINNWLINLYSLHLTFDLNQKREYAPLVTIQVYLSRDTLVLSANINKSRNIHEWHDYIWLHHRPLVYFYYCKRWSLTFKVNQNASRFGSHHFNDELTLLSLFWLCATYYFNCYFSMIIYYLNNRDLWVFTFFLIGLLNIIELLSRFSLSAWAERRKGWRPSLTTLCRR